MYPRCWEWRADGLTFPGRAFAVDFDLLPCRGFAGIVAVARRRLCFYTAHRADRVSRGIFVFAAVVARRVVHFRRLPTGGVRAVDYLAADSLSPGSGWHQPVRGGPDDVSDAYFRAGFVEQYRSPGERIFCDAVDAGKVLYRRVFPAGFVFIL